MTDVFTMIRCTVQRPCNVFMHIGKSQVNICGQPSEIEIYI